jgi:hypothetical protein
MGPLSRDIVVVGVSDSSLTVRKEYPVPERRGRVGECDAMIQHHPELRFRVVEVAIEPNVEEVGGGGWLDGRWWCGGSRRGRRRRRHEVKERLCDRSMT